MPRPNKANNLVDVPFKVQRTLDAAAKRGLVIEERPIDKYGCRTWVITSPTTYETTQVWVFWLPGRTKLGVARFQVYSRLTFKARTVTRSHAHANLMMIAPYVDSKIGSERVWLPDATYNPKEE